MARNGLTNKERVLKAWKQASWPPALGDQVRLFQPKDYRGSKAKVIAVGDEQSKVSTRKAPKGKIRIALKTPYDVFQFTVSKDQCFPVNVTLKELQAQP
jgi:hypothetical protein